jgi:hypothetical protein
MGGSESTLAGLEGFQVVRVTNNSPAHVAGFVPFFDFITAVDKLHLDRENPSFFFDYVRRNKDKAITCQVFNLRCRGARDLTLVPTDSWGGVGLLGCNVCWETADAALESTWHIVDVVPRSPAFKADLMAHRDYILGMQPAHDGAAITTFRDGSDFHSRVEEWRARMAVAPRNAPRTLLLMVFDSVDNSVKEVLVDMAGAHSLGIDVANGYLHVVPATPNSDRIPMVSRFVVSAASQQAAAQPDFAAAAPRTQQQPADTAAPPPEAADVPNFPSPPRIGAEADQPPAQAAAHETPVRAPVAPEVPPATATAATPMGQTTAQPQASHSGPPSPSQASPASPAPMVVPPPTPAAPVQAPAAASPFPAPQATAPPQQPAFPAPAVPAAASPFPAPAAASPFPAARTHAAPSFPMPPPRS